MTLALLDRLGEAGPLFALAIVLSVGMLAGQLARRLHLPGITGQVVVGVVMGKAGLDLFGDRLHALQPLTLFALGLISVTVGAHLNLRRLRNAGRRLFFLFLLEATVTPTIVFLGLWGIGRLEPRLAALFASAAVATAPATIVALVQEARAKGVFVKTLVAAVALNNMACIFLFEVVRTAGASGLGAAESWTGPARQLLLALLIGGGIALLMELVARWVAGGQRLTTAAVLALLFASGTASYLGVSPLLACLFLGLVQTNVTRTRDQLVDSVFEDFQPVILAAFFTLAGMHLSFEHAAVAGILAVAYFVLRGAGKLAAAALAMRLARAPRTLRRNLGLALLPQAGVAVALVILLQEDPRYADVALTFSAVVLTAVTINEVVGPLFVRVALRRAGEVGMDRVRLMDFLQEESIVLDFAAETKQDAIARLVELLIATHHLDIPRDELLATVLEREAQASTCFGGGLAVPHGLLPPGKSMVGVMAISRAGLRFETPDGLPVHCMVLLATAPEERERHLQVLGALARTVGTDPTFQQQLFNAKTPAHASLLLHGEESHGFNHFLEEE